ncbi:hypothetical protein B0A52_07763 [Exophiala mesophila]|uniref:AMP-dependent synthetase/ligase domain-containing protein n=1 Tax=Exophiala mesophila TaxID=212818 RepID=A0A438MY05_EXOME|nr:hypothetical protein B0A52_07763 [Exophiala mesophila]
MPFNPLGLPLEWCSREYRAEHQQDLKGKKYGGPVSKDQPLWSPPAPEKVPMSLYRHHINRKFSQNLKDSHDLHKWSVQNRHEFWIDLYEYAGIIPALPPGTKQAYDPKLRLRDIPKFFPGHKLNYAENVLVPNTSTNPNAVALVGVRETALDNPEEITWSQLTELVRTARSALIHQGIKKNDVIAALMANSIWIIVLFLASSSIGAIFTSVSPDMGAAGCVSRFSQVNPKLLFTDTDLAIRGIRPSMIGKVLQILKALPKDNKSPRVVFVPTCHRPHLVQNLEYIKPLGESLHTFLSVSKPSDQLSYTRLPTDHPLVIVYSSGTTGEPKCIVSPHISILNYKKISSLHNSLGPQSTVFQYSSTSWILWNVMNGHLSVGAKVICYDGGALYPGPATMLRICDQFKATYWGTSPRYLLELEQSGIKPSDFDLSNLTLVTTTGATLTGEQFTWFYTAFPKQIHLSSVAGGTDIASSWVATNPAGPVYANEMQMWALGHDCDILDTNSTQGESIAMTGQPGELICRNTFPSMPCRFWGDDNHQKYRAAYFEKFETVNPTTGQPDFLDVWAQHDFILMNPRTRGVQILGRSDGVLNPSGIRFGSSEIYNIVEGPGFNNIIADTLCVGRRRPSDKDETVFLFVIMAPGHENEFNNELVERIRSAIREGLSPRHVPKFIFQIREIPYTVNGKKVELAIKKIISGEKVKASSTVRNPQCLADFEKYVTVEREPRSSRL